MAPFLNNTGFLLLVFHSWHTHTQKSHTQATGLKNTNIYQATNSRPYHQAAPTAKVVKLGSSSDNTWACRFGSNIAQCLLDKIHKLLHGKHFNFNLPMLIQFQCLGHGIYLAPNWTSSLNMANFPFGRLKGCLQQNQFFLACWIDVIFGVSIKGRLNIFGRMYLTFLWHRYTPLRSICWTCILLFHIYPKCKCSIVELSYLHSPANFPF